jgi:hypothetical protein
VNLPQFPRSAGWFSSDRPFLLGVLYAAAFRIRVGSRWNTCFDKPNPAAYAGLNIKTVGRPSALKSIHNEFDSHFRCDENKVSLKQWEGKIHDVKAARVRDIFRLYLTLVLLHYRAY